jgi:hypothetical protein
MIFVRFTGHDVDLTSFLSRVAVGPGPFSNSRMSSCTAIFIFLSHRHNCKTIAFARSSKRDSLTVYSLLGDPAGANERARNDDPFWGTTARSGSAPMSSRPLESFNNRDVNGDSHPKAACWDYPYCIGVRTPGQLDTATFRFVMLSMVHRMLDSAAINNTMY